MVWHKRLGLILIGLLVYRVVWGLIGPSSARLLPLLPRPRALLDYIRSLKARPYTRSLGHNPIGGLSVLALLGVLIFQTGTGLVSVNVDGLASGWFGHLVAFDMGRFFSDLHETGFNLLLGLMALHVLAIALYALLLRANLIGPMVTGYQTRANPPKDHAPVRVSLVRFGLAVLAALISVGLVLWLGR